MNKLQEQNKQEKAYFVLNFLVAKYSKKATTNEEISIEMIPL